MLIATGTAGISDVADVDLIADQTADLLLGILTPSLSGAITTEHQSQAQRRLEPAALALARYRIDHGRYPPMLQSLIPNYLDALTPDRFGNQSLHYKREAEGYVLYSIGSNLTDDGGHHDFREGDIVLHIPWSLSD